jgi:hypothetical protein
MATPIEAASPTASASRASAARWPVVSPIATRLVRS